jgi:prolipoprotein diacylglyceryltransferase
MLFGLLAARMAYVLVFADRYATTPWIAVRLTDGGFLVFAGFAATMS